MHDASQPTEPESFEWARNIGRVTAKLGQPRAVPLFFREAATVAFLAGYDDAKAEKDDLTCR